MVRFGFDAYVKGYPLWRRVYRTVRGKFSRCNHGVIHANRMRTFQGMVGGCVGVCGCVCVGGGGGVCVCGDVGCGGVGVCVWERLGG